MLNSDVKKSKQTDSQASSSTQQDFEVNIPQKYHKYFDEFPEYLPTRLISQRKNTSVWLTSHKISGEKLAVKILRKFELSESENFHLTSQVKALKELKSHHFAQAKEIKETEQLIFIVMEFFRNGDLANYFNKEPYFNTQTMLNKIDKSRKLIAEIFIALKQVHKKGYVFQDLKPENILFDEDGRVKLCDFGLAIQQNLFDGSFCGTIQYMAPERLSHKMVSKPVDANSDIWSLGIIIYEIICGQLPYSSESAQQQLQLIYQGIHFPNKFPTDARNLVQKCLSLNPEKRPTEQEFMNHKFFSSYHFDWQQVKNRTGQASGYIKIKQKPTILKKSNGGVQKIRMLPLFD